ncbi:beta-ketoacyl-[acyl-carrier-protein] synthase family protein [Oleiagrimonas sp.]|jgi:nodulation protein E|uniref:beta-ketoacyl-[acyl-carrier-protein] synthase family protein n=1 Tax=Oleiagrimonas sp. TaxID=2010330 RepID=UPI002628AFA1|nr:beta-ketoacyl-[acyl-carrier-protein] synthase family protein [Oleiagrimonas sp.]MDA3914488.1 beta-ketoacyl-[acyl-carrier-protein] synthase family protein [Oleiagrimonas sp.]
MRRVVITGMGTISALGHNADSAWKAMREGRSAIAALEGFDEPTLRVNIAAQVRDFDPAAHFERKKLPLLDRVSQFTLVAAREAVAQSGLDFSQSPLGHRTACVIGTGVGGEQTNDASSRKLYAEGSQRLHPLTIVRRMNNAPASQLCIEFGLRGPSFAVSSACASANHALAQALALIRSGSADVAVAGGTEACITLGVLRAWESMRVLADDTCRPFCKQRHGLVLGEGAGVFVLEEYEHARARGATILAEFAGAGMTADAEDMVAPSVDGAARAMQLALDDAGLGADEIGYINAHGTGTPANDPTETRAIHQVFGDHAMHLGVSSTKSVHGHALGAAGALELVAVIGALREGVLPPTANFIDPDPECDLDYVPNTARESAVGAALSNSFAFGGLNAVLALKKAG